MCTWSGIRWPSSIRLSFCAAKRRRTSPRYGRSWPNRAFRRPFGMNTTWYLHSHREWLRLSNSSIVARPSVCLAAHGSERHDGPPNMSNFSCLPGIAGGLPSFIYLAHVLTSGSDRADRSLAIRRRMREMAWTAEDRRKYAPAIQEVLRRGMLVRLAATIDTIDPPPKVGRPRDWSTLTMLGALWHLARDGCVWRRLPVGPCLPPHQSVWSRFLRWRLRAVLDRALAVLVACRRLAGGRKRRPTAAIIDTQSVKTGPQHGPRGDDGHKKVKGGRRGPM